MFYFVRKYIFQSEARLLVGGSTVAEKTVCLYKEAGRAKEARKMGSDGENCPCLERRKINR